MARRGFQAAALAVVATVVWGCARPAAPPPVVTPASVTTVAPRSAPQTPAPPPKVAVRCGPTFAIQPARATLLPGDLGLQMIALPACAGPNADFTREVAWSTEPAGVVAVDANGYIHPLAPGQAKVRARRGEETTSIQVTVAPNSGRTRDFAADVVPILTRAGCNSGACHGKADGQNGFHLSLYGYDPAGDYRAVSRDSSGRRLTRIDPAASLLLLKATGLTPHGGGPRLSTHSDEYRALLAWVAAGAPEGEGPSHGAVTRIEVSPGVVRLDEPGPQQLRVVATFADGHERDVTRLATYRVNDDASARIDAEGRAVLLRRAETDLVVRYGSHVVSTRLATLINPGLSFDFAKLKRRNFIDEELYKRLESLKVPPSPPASDASFLRRASLDLVGRLPSPEQIRKYLADKDPDKRIKLIDQLLADRDFVKSWRIKFGDMLQITTARQGNGASRFQAWVDESLRDNTPWDVMVRTMLTAVGPPEEFGHGPANYALDGPDAKTRAEQSAQRFLGLRIRCAQCHDHPFDVWTQDDYFGLAACFAKVERSGGGGMMGKTVVKINPNGQVEHLRTRKPAAPRLLDGTSVDVAAKDDPRAKLADWITSAENPFFARAMANWAWAQFFGKGLADPPDDLSRSNPPVHPELLDKLARHFVAHKYDLRDLIRTIAISEAYALSSGTVPGNERDARLFSHHVPRPLGAHQMADALAQATDVVNRYPNRAAGTRAIEVADPATASTILDTFGRCPRTNGCSTVATPALSLRQSLLLIGGDTIESKVTNLGGYLSNLLDLKPEPEEIVENLYYRTLCRPPTAEELSHWSAELKQAETPREAAEDLFWALLNSREFAFNH